MALFLLAVQIPSFSQSLSERDGQFTQEELVLDDKFISLNVDHFNTSLLLMLSYYYPRQFIFIDNEVKDLVDEYVNGKDAGHKFIFRIDHKPAIGVMLKQDLLERFTAALVLKFFFSKSVFASGMNIVIHEDGYAIPSEVWESITLFYDENSDAIHNFESDIISLVKRRIGPMVDFLGKERQFDYLLQKSLGIYITLANNIQYLQGMADDHTRNGVMLYGVASENEDAVLFFHELAHIWFSTDKLKGSIIGEAEKSDKRKEYIKILQNCVMKTVQGKSVQSESIADLVDIIYDVPFLSFNEFSAIIFSNYLASRYIEESFKNGTYRFPRIASMDKNTWTYAENLFDWLIATHYFDDARTSSDLQKMLYKEFVLFVLCMDQGLDYALENYGEFVK